MTFRDGIKFIDMLAKFKLCARVHIFENVLMVFWVLFHGYALEKR